VVDDVSVNARMLAARMVCRKLITGIVGDRIRIMHDVEYLCFVRKGVTGGERFLRAMFIVILLLGDTIYLRLLCYVWKH